jgi:hypothetical protein
VTVDAGGRIYAASQRTGAVHVFGPDGGRLRVCVPDKDDVPEGLSLPQLTVSDAGDIYLGLDGPGGAPRYLHFSAEGKRVGVETLGLDSIREGWYCQPGTDRRWVLGYEEVFLVDGGGEVLRTLSRRPDGRWLEMFEGAAVAPDGSLAVLSSGGEGPSAVSLYGPRGEPVRTFALPPAAGRPILALAYDGRRVVVPGEKEIFLFDASGEALGRFAPPPDDGASWTPFLAKEGRELLLFNGRTTLYRFAMP